VENGEMDGCIIYSDNAPVKITPILQRKNSHKTAVRVCIVPLQNNGNHLQKSIGSLVNNISLPT